MAYFAPEPSRKLLYNSLSDSYTAIGAPVSHPVPQMSITNGSQAKVTISFNGINDHLLLLPGATWISDIKNKQLLNQIWPLAQGTSIYVKTSDPISTGFVSFIPFYGAIDG